MAVTTQERVRQAAVKLFAAKGFHGTGIRDLAQEAGISSASLYHYMGTKEDLLAAIMRESLERLLAGAREVTAEGDPGQRLAALVALHVCTHARQPAETRVVDNEVHALSSAVRKQIVALRDEYERLWAGVLDEGSRAGVFDIEEPAVTRLALLEMCNGVARWFSPRGRLSLDRLAGHYAHLALRMAGSAAEADPRTLRHARTVVARGWRRAP